MVRPLPPGVRLTALFDSCHSGSVLDLPYVYSTDGKLIKKTGIKKLSQAATSAGKIYMSGNAFGALKALVGGVKVRFLN